MCLILVKLLLEEFLVPLADLLVLDSLIEASVDLENFGVGVIFVSVVNFVVKFSGSGACRIVLELNGFIASVEVLVLVVIFGTMPR